jgi:hypothetical protein
MAFQEQAIKQQLKSQGNDEHALLEELLGPQRKIGKDCKCCCLE